MFTRKTALLFFSVLVILAMIAAQCGQPPATEAPPEPTKAPEEAALAPSATPTLVPPTDTPIPPTDTPIPPTSQPAAGAVQVRESDGAEMVLVPAGEFTMGGEDGEDDEKPVHQVYLDAFWIDKTEVTNARFEKFVAATNYRTDAEKAGTGWVYTESGWGEVEGADWRHPSGPDSDIADKANHPVVQVSWNDAKAYCEWAGARLPTEAEWEKAARGTDGRTYPWGNEWDAEKVNSWEQGPGTTTAVGSYPAGASPYGALDMAGNVYEWAADWYDEGYYTSSPERNPTGPDSRTYRVLRGGSWYSPHYSARCANRDGDAPCDVDHDVGFRCARSEGGPTARLPTDTPIPPPAAVKIGDAWIRPTDGMVMVAVPAGEFTMGSEVGEGDEDPVHQVYLDAFWIDKTEVTNAQYRECWAAGKCQVSEVADNADFNGDAQPVVGLSWHDAKAYCGWAGARLPTEAEWEKAARGIDGRIYPWGNEWDAEKVNSREGPYGTTVVGSYPEGVSPYGALDMAGNVWEWVADWYGSNYYANSPERNPTGPGSGQYRVRRGGSWYDDWSGVRCANRYWYDPGNRNNYLGFRCARSEGGPTARLPTDTPLPAVAPTATPIPPTSQPAVEPVQVRESDGAEMVLVPAGEFTMGSTEAEIDAALALCNETKGDCEREWFERESPQHTVYLDAFWIDKTEVTNAQYCKCVAAGKCKASKYASDADFNGDAQPVVGVDWDDAKAYCEWAGARLPTEAEWEKAARGTDGRTYPWGNEWDGGKLNFCDKNCEYNWKDDKANDGYQYTALVGNYSEGASPYGALDMAGNVWEWTDSWYQAYPGSSYQGEGFGEKYRVLRGGSWLCYLGSVRCATRGWGGPGGWGTDVGFRCARS
jgi:formylglycine-generating enzyme required for sulfatase activity